MHKIKSLLCLTVFSRRPDLRMDIPSSQAASTNVELWVMTGASKTPEQMTLSKLTNKVIDWFGGSVTPVKDLYVAITGRGGK